MGQCWSKFRSWLTRQRPAADDVKLPLVNSIPDSAYGSMDATPNQEYNQKENKTPASIIDSNNNPLPNILATTSTPGPSVSSFNPTDQEIGSTDGATETATTEKGGSAAPERVLSNAGNLEASQSNNTFVSGDHNVIKLAINNPPPSTIQQDRVEFNIQECVPSFTGREDFIEDLHQDIFHNQTNTTSSTRSRLRVICGMAGVGKSETVRKYIERYKALYGHVLWINAERYSEAIECFRRIATKFSINLNFNRDQTKDEDILSQIYDCICQKFALIVFDNVESFNSDDGKNGLQQLLPQAIQTGWTVPAIIVTTRNRNWPNFTFRELQVFDEKESMTLLSKLKFRDNPSNRQLVQEVGRMCQDLPLGLQQVISHVQHQDSILSATSKRYTLKDFLEEVKLNKLKFLSTKPPGGVSQDLFTIIEMTFEKIESTNHGRLALMCLQTMTHLNPDYIPTILLEHRFAEEAGIAEAHVLLHNYGLVTRCDGFYKMHRLIQDIVRESKFIIQLLNTQNFLKELIECIVRFLKTMGEQVLTEVMDNAVRLIDSVSSHNRTEEFEQLVEIVATRLEETGNINAANEIRHREVERSGNFVVTVQDATDQLSQGRKLYKDVLLGTETQQSLEFIV